MIRAVSYNRARELFTITYNDRLRPRYRHSKVSPDLFGAFMSAESKGRFYRANIYGRDEYPTEFLGSGRRPAKLGERDVRAVAARRVTDAAHRAAEGTFDARCPYGEPALACLLFDAAVTLWGGLDGKVAAKNAQSCQKQMRYHETWCARHGIDPRVASDKAQAVIAEWTGERPEIVAPAASAEPPILARTA